MSADPINRPGESIAEADARYALTDAMSAAYAGEFKLWWTRSLGVRNGAMAYAILRDGEPKAGNCSFALFRLYRERGAMGAALLIAEKGLK
jgi:hypothetical protein